jgi:FixJ family two-component response regulator
MSGKDPVVFVVDDDVSIREALSSLVRSIGQRVEVFASAQEFLDAERPDVPSCLVLDIRLPTVNGLDLQARLARMDHPIPIVFLTAHGDIPMSVQAMKAGAVEFLTKPVREQDLLDAIQEALARDGAALARRAEMTDLRARLGSLTPREREVMEGVVAGLLNKQIATRLGIGEITVKVHRGRVMRKMRADSLADLVRSAATLGIPVQR